MKKQELVDKMKALDSNISSKKIILKKIKDEKKKDVGKMMHCPSCNVLCSCDEIGSCCVDGCFTLSCHSCGRRKCQTCCMGLCSDHIFRFCACGRVRCERDECSYSYDICMCNTLHKEKMRMMEKEKMKKEKKRKRYTEKEIETQPPKKKRKLKPKLKRKPKPKKKKKKKKKNKLKKKRCQGCKKTRKKELLNCRCCNTSFCQKCVQDPDRSNCKRAFIRKKSCENCNNFTCGCDDDENLYIGPCYDCQIWSCCDCGLVKCSHCEELFCDLCSQNILISDDFYCQNCK